MTTRMVEPDRSPDPETLEAALEEIERLRRELRQAAETLRSEAMWHHDCGKNDSTWRWHGLEDAAAFFNVRRFWKDA